MVKPIAPEEVTGLRVGHLPGFVIETWNRLILDNAGSGYSFTILQEDAIERLLSAGQSRGLDVAREDIFARKWLDIEDIYRAQGWKVEYDAPAYCESYPATFKFSKPR